MIGHCLIRNVPSLLGVPRRVLVAQHQRAVGERPQPAPLERRPQTEDLLDQRDGSGVPLPNDAARELVLDLAAAVVQLLDEKGAPYGGRPIRVSAAENESYVTLTYEKGRTSVRWTPGPGPEEKLTLALEEVPTTRVTVTAKLK